MLLVDLGFLGLSRENAGIILPFKQKKHQELDINQKAHNKWQTSVKVKETF
jgi:hypothetical protein